MKVTFLGHVLGQGHITLVPARLKLSSGFQSPADKKELIWFLGMAGYYRKFCHNFSTIKELLTALLRKGETLSCSVTCQQTFDKIKSILLSEPVLKVPNFEKPFSMFVDACDIGMGVVLLQEGANKMDHLVCCYSKKFNSH